MAALTRAAAGVAAATAEGAAAVADAQPPPAAQQQHSLPCLYSLQCGWGWAPASISCLLQQAEFLTCFTAGALRRHAGASCSCLHV